MTLERIKNAEKNISYEGIIEDIVYRKDRSVVYLLNFDNFDNFDKNEESALYKSKTPVDLSKKFLFFPEKPP